MQAYKDMATARFAARQAASRCQVVERAWHQGIADEICRYMKLLQARMTIDERDAAIQWLADQLEARRSA